MTVCGQEQDSASATVYLGLGSNIGDRAGYLASAVAGLTADPDIEFLDLSPVFESEYVGPGIQQPYLNACARIRTLLQPEALLKRLQEQEEVQGRLRQTHLQPRTLDLDILLWNDCTITTESLVVPHPGLTQRAFVLEPLYCLAPELEVPGSGRTVAELLAAIRAVDGPWIRIWAKSE